jgi:hypothetical protein
MFLLQYLLSIVEAFESWPTSILRSLFVEEPSRSNVMKLAAFFYGNALVVHIAVRFYVLCNGRRTVTITHHMYAAVFNWLLSERTPHLAMYYNVRRGRLLWINGWRLDNWEAVVFDVPPVIPLGTQVTGLYYRIIYKIVCMVTEPIPTLH